MTSYDYSRLQFFQNECRIKAQKYLRKTQVIKVLIILITIPCLFLADKYAWVLILSSCLLEILMQYYERKGVDLHKKSRDATQIMVIENSLSNEVKIDDFEYLFDNKGIMRNYDESKINKSYYDVLENKGTRRFALNIAESVLYTKYLFNKHEKRKKIEIVLLLLVSLLLIIVSFITVTGDNRYLIITPISALLSFLVVGELESYFDLSEVVKGLEKIDTNISNLIESNDFNKLSIFRLYSDYNTLTRETVPVPTRLYLKYRDDIYNVWKGRYQKYEEIFTHHASGSNELSLSTNFETELDPIYTERSKYISMIIRNILEKDYGSCTSVAIETVNSFSRSLVFKQTYRWRSGDPISIFTKFYMSGNELSYVTHILEELYKNDSTHYSRWIDDELLRQGNVLAYYDVNAFTQSNFQSLENLLLSDKWAENNTAFEEQVNAALKTNYSMLNSDLFSISYVRENAIRLLYNKKPGAYIIDLSWISDIDSTGTIHYDSAKILSELKGTALAEAKSIGRRNVDLLNWSDKNKVVGILNYNDVRYIVLLPHKNMFAPNNLVSIDFGKLHNINIYYTLEQYLEKHHQLAIPNTLLSDFEMLYDRLINISNWKICHNDFHASNIFISDDSFKIIDVENVGYSYPYADLCRLQISMLAYYSKYTRDNSIVTEFFDCVSSSSINSKFSMTSFLISLKNCFANDLYTDFHTKEYLASLSLEVLLQIYYSICSNISLTQDWVDGYNKIVSIVKQ